MNKCYTLGIVVLQKLISSNAEYLHFLTNVQCKSDISPDTFKDHLDKWLRTFPDMPKIDNYGAYMSAESNSICDQAKQVGQASDPKRG